MLASITSEIVVGLVSGLAGFFARAWYEDLLREKENLTRFRSAVGFASRELEYNGIAVERYETGNAPIQSVQAELRTQDWEAHKKDATRWAFFSDLDTIYDEIERTRVRGAPPPSSQSLREVAAKVRVHSMGSRPWWERVPGFSGPRKRYSRPFTGRKPSAL